MTTLYTRDGRRYVPATADQVAREVARRSDWRDAVSAALASMPEDQCRDCAGLVEGGRVMRLDHGAHVWRSCAQCVLTDALSAIVEATVPADS